MKTKHLFFAAALPLVFAACQSDELEVMTPTTDNSSDARPLVDAKLNFQDESTGTRISYDGSGYGWTESDVIAALLMDEIRSENRPYGTTAAKWNKESWWEHYKLVDHIHTAYPFSWNKADKEWQAPSKLQEGNYFFAAPASENSYGGQRMMIHRIDNQIQTGGDEAAMNKAIADNQFFVGYAQVKAGTGNKEAIVDAKMTPVLSPVKFKLTNVGTAKRTIKQVVIRGGELATAITIDPTKAAYYGTKADYSLKTDKEGNAYTLKANSETTFFNYANLIGATNDLYDNDAEDKYAADNFVYNVGADASDYSAGDAMRAMVNPVFTENAKWERQAVLNFTEPVEINTNETVEFAVLLNSVPNLGSKQKEDEPVLAMDITFLEGQMANVDLTKDKLSENGAGTGNNTTILTNMGIKCLKPNVINNVTIDLDNNSVVASSTITVSSEDVLLSFITWNQPNNRTNTATIIKDIHFTKDMWSALGKSIQAGTLKLTAGATGAKIILDADVPLEALALLNEESDINVVVNGERTLSKETSKKLTSAIKIENAGNITIADGADLKVKVLNEGTVTLQGESYLFKSLENNNKIVNNGEVYCQGNLTNNSLVENNGELYNVVNANEGTIVVGEGDVITHTDSDAGIIDITKNFDAKITDSQTTHKLVYTLSSENQPNGISIEKLSKKAYLKTLIIDGGKVNGTTNDDYYSYGGGDTRVLVTKNGATLAGTAGEGNAFAGKVTLNGAVTVSNFSFGNVTIASGVTTVTGTTAADVIYIGSCVEGTMTPVAATLEIANGVELKANDIVNNGIPTDMCKVKNNGTVTCTTTNGVINDDKKITWNVNPPVDGPDAERPTETTEAKSKTITYTYVIGSSNSIAYSPEVNWTENTSQSIKATITGKTLFDIYQQLAQLKKDHPVQRAQNGIKYTDSKGGTAQVLKIGVSYSYDGNLSVSSDLTFQNDQSNMTVYDDNKAPGGNDVRLLSSSYLNIGSTTNVTVKNATLTAKHEYALTVNKLTLSGEVTLANGTPNTLGETFLTVSHFDYSGVTKIPAKEAQAALGTCDNVNGWHVGNHKQNHFCQNWKEQVEAVEAGDACLALTIDGGIVRLAGTAVAETVGENITHTDAGYPALGSGYLGSFTTSGDALWYSFKDRKWKKN